MRSNCCLIACLALLGLGAEVASSAPPNQDASISWVDPSYSGPGPVSSSGKPVTAETPLAVGDVVQIEWGGQWYPADVLQALPDGRVKVHFRGWSSSFDEIVARSRVQLSPDGIVKGQRTGKTSIMRTWTDITGKFKTEAELVEFKNGRVTLRKKDAKVIEMPVEKLGKADQDFLNSLAAEPDTNNPLQPPGRSPAGSSAGTDPLPVAKADWSEVNQIILSDPGQWSLKPDPAAQPPRLTSRPVVLSRSPGGGNAGFFESVKALVFQPSEAVALVAHVDESPGGQGATRLEKCDLVKGKSLGWLMFPGTVIPLDVDSTGKRILAVPGKLGWGDNYQLDIWDISAKEAQHVMGWEPYGSEDWTKREHVQMAAFVDADHVLTVSQRERLVVWNADSRSAIWSLELFFGSRPALSPGRKQLAVATKPGVFIVDPLTGASLGRLPGQLGFNAHFRFSEDGRRLAGLSQDRLQVWDTERGELTHDVYVADSIGLSGMDWVADGYLLLDGAKLLDLERRIVLWEYQRGGHPNPGGLFGGVYWYVLKDHSGPTGLYPFTLPHEAAKQAAANIDPSDILAVRPGAQVSIQVKAALSAEERREIQESLASQLQDSGMTVVQNSRLVLEASTAQGKTKEVTYQNMFGSSRGGGGSTMQITEQISQLTFKEDGRVLWKARQVLGAPVFVNAEEGESMDSAVAKKLKPTVAFFVNARIPKYIARPPQAGASTVTPQGIQPATLR